MSGASSIRWPASVRRNPSSTSSIEGTRYALSKPPMPRKTSLRIAPSPAQNVVGRPGGGLVDVVVQEVPERGHRAVVGGLVVVGAEYAAQPGIRVEGGADADEGVAVDEHVGVDEHEHVAGRALGSGIACFRRPRARTGRPRR